MIIVVEGPSGAGKTTWCRTHAGANALLEALPDHATVPTDPHAAARFWVERNVARWREVLEREKREEWTMQRDIARDAFAAGRYALADMFLVSDVDAATLRARREADPTRTRSNFERHVLLRNSLMRWYSAIDRLEPSRVMFGLPADEITADLLAKGKRVTRSGLLLFDQLMGELAVL